MKYNRKSTNQITIDEKVLEQTEAFTYVDIITNKLGNSSENVKAQIGSEIEAFAKSKYIWNSKNNCHTIPMLRQFCCTNSKLEIYHNHNQKRVGIYEQLSTENASDASVVKTEV